MTMANHFVELYPVQQGKYWYWHYCYERIPGNFTSVKKIHIPGSIEVIDQRVDEVREMIASGILPAQIERHIVENWSRRSVGRKLAAAVR